MSAEQTGDNEVTFRFDVKNNRELPQIVGQLLYVLPKHFWEGTDATATARSVEVDAGDPARLGSLQGQVRRSGRSITTSA